MSGRIYLDYNATAPTRSEVRDAVAEALMLHGNPSSVHEEGRSVRALVEQARENVAALVGANPKDVIFTSGGTEANVTALSALNVSRDAPEKVVCFMSEIEHPSVLESGRFTLGAIRLVGATVDGIIDVASLESAIAAHCNENDESSFMVSIMRANNETGALQPVSEVSRIVREHGGILHCDGVQAAGKIPLDITDLNPHMLSLSAHKIGGPHGIGALVLGEGFGSLPSPLIVGGGQEMRARSGTENVAGIAGFGAAALCAAQGLESMAKLAQLRDKIEQGVLSFAPDAVIFSKDTERLPNTANFAVAGMKAETIVIALDLAGVAVSAGASCSSGKVSQSHVLVAMGVPEDMASSAIRVSLGWDTSDEEIDAFIAAWSNIYESFLRKRTAA
jgi:cysteine desulfurase